MLSDNIDFLALDTLFNALNINRATGYRYLNRISKILVNSDVWLYQSRDGSLDNDGIKIFEIFTDIAKEHSPQFAEKLLIKELKNHGFTIETNQQNRQSNRQSKTKGTGNSEQSNPATKSPNFYDSLLGI
jgi:hypothetical protein